MTRLWLDDVRPAPEGWLHVRTTEQAQAVLIRDEVEEASLDYDLSPVLLTESGVLVAEAPTGYDLCVWMVETGNWPKRPPSVHSCNEGAARRMRELIAKHFPG